MQNKIITAARKHIYTRYFEQSSLMLKKSGSVEFEEREGETTVSVYCEVEEEQTEARQNLLVVCEFGQDAVGWVLVTAESWQA